ncbi:kinase-like protein [Gigaspora margarita]|uniref:Kinase-like protein n=1 Tax=Gigaspora margarita TaxID=4874 RepID=A0A8H3XCI5_GIGMA|nr:kinase-like protein [Gigaspora margarita]
MNHRRFVIVKKHITLLEHDKFIDKEEIDRGGYGVISKSKMKTSEGKEKVVAIKKNEKQKIAKNEIIILFTIRDHQNIINFHGIIKTSDECYGIVLQFADEGNLQEYLNKNFLRLEWTDKLRIATEITDGLAFIHQKRIIHCDFKTKNILVRNKTMLIADFGLSKRTYGKDNYNFGVSEYTDPQCINGKYDQKSDIYSLGIILWEISNGKPPHESHEPFEVKELIPVEGTPTKYVNLYQKCRDKDPQNRPNVRAVHKILCVFAYQTEHIQHVDLYVVQIFFFTKCRK